MINFYRKYRVVCILLSSFLILFVFSFIVFYGKNDLFKLPFIVEVWGNAADWVMLITIYFLYRTYTNEKENLKISKNSVDLDMATGFVFNQLPLTRSRLHDGIYSDIFKNLTNNFIIDKYNFNKQILDDDFKDRIDLNLLFEFLKDEIDIYKHIIDNGKYLTEENKKTLGKIIATNIDYRFLITLKKFIDTSEKFVKELEFIEYNNDEGQEYRLKNLEIAKYIYHFLN